MILSYTPLNLEMELQENKVLVLQIESKEFMQTFVGDVWKQSQGENGEVVWYDSGRTLSIAKNAEIVINPFAIDCNNRKVLNKLYQDLNTVAQTEMVEETMIVNSSILTYLEKMIEYLSYRMEYQLDLDIPGIMKLYGVQISKEEGSLAERVAYYVKVMHQICGISLFFFINLSEFLSDEDLKNLYQTLLYEKVQIVLIEGKEKQLSEFEEGFIVDKDCCIIKNSRY